MNRLQAAAWRFLGVHSNDTAQSTLEALCGLRERIRQLDDEAELRRIEDEVDAMLRAQLAKSSNRDESGADAQALIAAAHRLDNLIHHRRVTLSAKGFSLPNSTDTR